MAAKYREAPAEIPGYPTGIPFIVGNEAAERFSFWGMVAILQQYMMTHLSMSEPQAAAYVHFFFSWVFFLPLFGGVLADAFLGKYRTIIFLSIVYCFGHFALAVDETRLGLFIGLTLIAVGAGGVKPCVAAHVGDQFGRSNQHLLPKVFAWFYFSTNFGALFAMFLIPYLLHEVGPWLAFGVPGILMLFSTVVFWLGRHRFVHIPPGGMASVRETFSPEGLRAIRSLTLFYVAVAAFWSLGNQISTTWVAQANRMDLVFLDHEWLPEQVQALGPTLVLVFVPLFGYVIYPLVGLVFPLTALRKISIGLFVAAIAAAIPAVIDTWIQAGEKPNIAWQMLAYVPLTAAEVMVAIPFLEFSYTQAPKRMKSLVMSLYLVAIAAGNLFASAVNFYYDKQREQAGEPAGDPYRVEPAQLARPEYFWFFAGLLLAAAFGFIVIARLYRPRTYVQGTDG
ncbi:MAG: MFS transporter [Planctomycetales bacterium]